MFQKIIIVVNDEGIVYQSKKGKEKARSNGLATRRWSEDAENASVPVPVTSASSGLRFGEDGESGKIDALMVGVQYHDGSCRYCFIPVMKSMDAGLFPRKSALRFYRSLLCSQDGEAQYLASYIEVLDSRAVWLATAHKPLFMDAKDFCHPSTGFEHLGTLEALQPHRLIAPTTEQNTSFGAYGLTNVEDAFVLYIWVGVSLRPS